MTALRELFAKFDVQFDTGGLVAGAAAVEGVVGKLKKFAGVLAGGIIVHALTGFVEGVIDAGHELIVTSEQLGISAEALKTWQAIGKLAGVETEELNQGLKILQKNAYAASQGGEEQAKAFKKLGVHVKGANGELKGADELMAEIATGMAGTTNETERVALAQQLLGRAGSKLLPILTQGAAGVQAMKDRLEDLGISFSADGARKAEEAHKAITLFNLVLSSLRTKLVLGIIPYVTQFFTLIAEGAGHFNRLTKNTNFWQAALVALGITAGIIAANIIIAFLPIVLSTLAIGAAVAAAILVIDDLITLFDGGKSVIGEWIDKQYGAGTAAQWVQQAKEWWIAFKQTLDEWIPSASAVWDFIKDIGAAINALADDIAYVIDQFKHLGQLAIGKGPWADQLGAWGRKALGMAPAAGSDPSAQDVGVRGGEGLFSGMRRYAGDSDPSKGAFLRSGSSGSVTLPEQTISGGGGSSVTVHVDANAKPDPQLVPLIQKAVADGLGLQNRKLAAAFGGS